MTNTVIANGNTYTDDDDPDTGMGAGGFRVRLLPMLSDVMHDTELAMTSSASSAALAQAAAASALLAPGTSATSTTSLSVNSLGSKIFTMQPGKDFVLGSYLLLARASALSTWIFGQLVSYNSGTGAAEVNATKTQGSGSGADWIISLSSPNAKDSGGAGSGQSATLTATSNKFWELTDTAASPLPTVNLQGSGATLAGPFAFSLANRSQNFGIDLAVEVGAALRGFIRPGKSAEVDVGSGGGYTSGDLSSYGADIKAQIAFSSIVAGTGGVWTKALQLPGGNTLLLVHGASLHAVIFSPNFGWGTPLLIRSGLSTAGGDGTVMAQVLNDGTDNVLIASCPDNGTALQTVVLAVSGVALSLGTMVATTLGTASVRLLDLRGVPNSLGNNTLILSVLGSTTVLQNYGIVVLAGAITMTVGAVRTDTTTSSFGAICVTSMGGSTDVYLSLSSTATVLTAKAVSINPTTGVQTLGTSATTAVTSAAGILVREIPGDYIVLAYLNTLPKAAKLSLSGTTPTIASVTAMTTAITTANTYALTSYHSLAYFSAAVSGTDSAGRFITEMVRWDVVGFTPLTSVTISMNAAHTVVWVGEGNGVNGDIWQLLSAAELAIANGQNASGIPNVQRMSGLGIYAQALSAPEANYPRYARPRTTLQGQRHVLGVTDGTKPSVDFSRETCSAEATPGPVSLINQASFSHLVGDQDYLVGYNGQWLAAGAAPSLTLTLQRTRLA